MPKLTGFAPVPIRGPRAFPFVGAQVGFLRLMADPIGRLLALRPYGDVVAVADGSPAVVVTYGPERNREVLSSQASYDNEAGFFFRVPPGSSLDTLSKALVFQAGDSHRRHRRAMMPAFQKAALDGYAPDLVSVTRETIGRWPVGQTADIAALTRQLVQHVVVKCLYGIAPDFASRGLGAAATELVDWMTAPQVAAFPYAVPGSPYARVLELAEETVQLLRGLVEEKRRSRGSTDALALVMRACEEEHLLSEEELLGEALTLFVAGHDTQAQTLAWTLFLLGQHPKVLADVLDEIDSVLRGGAPAVEHIPRMVLVDRVIKESMRVLAPVPITFLKVAQSDVQLGPYMLPPGANVVVSPFLTHRDPERYPEPARFLPERWEEIQPSVYEYLPFGAGPRMCIGAAMATMGLRLMLPMILQKYRLSLAYGAKVSRFVRGNILSPRHGLPMLIAPQDRHFVKREKVRGDISEIVDLS